MCANHRDAVTAILDVQILNTNCGVAYGCRWMEQMAEYGGLSSTQLVDNLLSSAQICSPLFSSAVVPARRILSFTLLPVSFPRHPKRSPAELSIISSVLTLWICICKPTRKGSDQSFFNGWRHLTSRERNSLQKRTTEEDYRRGLLSSRVRR